MCTHTPSLTHWHMHRQCQVRIKPLRQLSLPRCRTPLPWTPLASPSPLPHRGGPTSWNYFQQIFKVVIGCSRVLGCLSPDAVCSPSLHLSLVLFLLPFLENENTRRNVLLSAVWQTLLQITTSKMKHLTGSKRTRLLQLWNESIFSFSYDALGD